MDHLPHNEVMEELLRSPILLLPLNDTPNVLGIVPGKLFEYLAARRPIFAIGHTAGDTARIIRETLSGTILSFNDKQGMKNEIMRMYQLYRSGKLDVVAADITNYSRKAGSRSYADLLNVLKSH